MGPNAEPAGIGLSLPVSRFIGRADELDRLSAYFRDGARLVTLWGAGGIGKTRLALQFAAHAQDRLPDVRRALFCDLDEARDLAGLCIGMARSLDVPLPSGGGGPEELVQRIGDVLRGRGPALVVLDNFDRLAPTAPDSVARWMTMAPEARFLVTSRERLRIEGEEVDELGPLSLAVGADGVTSDAVALFLDRAAAQGLPIDEEVDEQVGELVAELEGIPLAIELAAGRVDMLGVEGMLEIMRQHDDGSNEVAPVSAHPRLDVLAGGRRDQSGRQRTVRAAIEWSWEALNEQERLALAQCAVFRGGFTPVAATRVLDIGTDVATALDVIQSLRNKSLLRSYQNQRGHVRLSLYESVREFASSKLEELAATEAALARHERFFLDVAKRLSKRATPNVDALAAELENLMAVAERSLQQGDRSDRATAALEALVAAAAVYEARGPLGFYLDWLDRALAQADQVGDVPERVMASALRTRGRWQTSRGRADEGLADLSRALELAQSAGDRRTEGHILADTGVVHHHARRIDEARHHYSKALDIHRGLGEKRAVGRALGNLGALHHDEKSFDEALRFYRQAIAIFRETKDRRAEGIFHCNVGVLHHERGAHESARASFEEALSIIAEVGDRRFEAIALGNAGALDHEDGRISQARSRHERALMRIREFGDRRSEAFCLSRLASTVAEDGDIDHAERLFDDADALLAHSEDWIAQEAIAVSRGFVELARAREKREDGEVEAASEQVDRARARIVRARTASAQGPTPAEVNDTVRVALRILERALDDIDTGADEALAPPDDALLVGPGCRWVRPPNQTWQDFRRRRALRLIMDALVEGRRANLALDLEALREAGWPGENIQYEAAMNRVHVALAELRKRGLKGTLLRTDEGYQLDRSVDLRAVPDAMCPS